MSHCNILFLQEHWLADVQLSTLANICPNLAFTGISGFDNSNTLAGRPYGGCAIIRQSTLLLSVCPLVVDSRRLCAARVSFDIFKLLLVNVYMPSQDGVENLDKLMNVFKLIDNLLANNSDCHAVLGGVFNVDFCRDWAYTALLNSFCDEAGLTPVIRHCLYN